MDTTYFGRSFGVMVLIDSISGKALSVSEVKYETNEQYFTAIGSLKAKGIEIQSIVCDGRRGLVQMFPDILMCVMRFACFGVKGAFVQIALILLKPRLQIVFKVGLLTVFQRQCQSPKCFACFCFGIAR